MLSGIVQNPMPIESAELSQFERSMNATATRTRDLCEDVVHFIRQHTAK